MRPRPQLDDEKRRLIWGRLIEAPRIDSDACTGCGTCVADCSGYILELRDGKCRVVAPAACFGCGHCGAVCPERAVVQPESNPPEVEDFPTGPPLTAEALTTFLSQRRSVRVFRSKAVERDVLQRVADAARLAPTGANKQNVGLVVVSSRERVDELRSLTERFCAGMFAKLDNPLIARLVAWKAGAETVTQMRMYAQRMRWLLDGDRPSPYFPLPFGPAVMVAHAPKSDSTAAVNCIAALHSSALMALAEGLGSCYLGFVAAGANMDRAMRSWLGIPRENQCHGAMVLGYPKVKYRRPVRRPGLKVTWR